jgi:hypothetical protein
MSYEQTINRFIERIGEPDICGGMKVLKRLGIVEMKPENIDEKGYGWVFEMNGVMIRYCPCCGEKIPGRG